MNRSLRLVAVVLVLALLGASPSTEVPANADSQYTTLAKAYYAENFRLNPINATQVGVHDYDDQIGDLHGKAVYEGACAGCHGWSGISPSIAAASLTGTRAINDPKGNNVVQVILRGGQRHAADTSVYMPEFGSAYSDSEIASVANYVTARFGAQGSTLTTRDIVKMRAAD